MWFEEEDGEFIIFKLTVNSEIKKKWFEKRDLLGQCGFVKIWYPDHEEIVFHCRKEEIKEAIEFRDYIFTY